jgi:Cu2+-containing amine oxidase
VSRAKCKTDSGNFQGVVIYIQGQEVVVVSELQAGWYQYISEWRLHADGTIRPRFGFSAVENSCVCEVHHHVYWRFDFDILSEGNNVVWEYNSPPVTSSNWHINAGRSCASGIPRAVGGGGSRTRRLVMLIC